MQWWIFALILISIYCILIVILRWNFPEKHLNWESINLEKLEFPSEFMWGVATASHQIEGNNKNNWSEFESNKKLELSGIACDHWNRWKSDFDLIENLGAGHYRFSIEWSRIQPKEEEWSDESLEQYSQMVEDLISRNIEPMI
ncbi:MAG: hypothetical protein CL983_02910, partial [Euryarchaeota archaeon]|nr:hypothetical protein [Euryarchaeota archaeon]